MSSEKGRIEADIAEAKANKKDALKAGREALAGDIEKRLLALQEDLKNERQRLNYERDLELAKAQHKGYSVFIPYNITTAGK
jgi:molecular chaperone GrpE (heat shock protein)